MKNKATKNIYEPTEYEIQCAFFEWVRLFEEKIPELKLCFATLNGIRLPIGLALKAKKQGNRRGVSDIFLLCRRGKYSGLASEFKTKKGVLSEHQKEFFERIEKEGFKTEVWRNVDQAIEAVKNYLYF